MLTKGWDTISIVKKERINSDLASAWAGVDSHFSYDNKSGANVNGLFACWSIIDGGGGRILRLQLPIQSGEFTMGQIKINLENTSAIIEITLSLLPLQNNTTVLKSEYLNLAKDRSEMIPEKKGWILPVTFLDPGGHVGALSNVVLDSICKYLLSNPKQFELIFAEINFAKSGSPDWVIPKKCAYSYLDSGYLAVLSVCSEKDISQLPLDIDITGISLGINSFYIMSSELMIKGMILPGLMCLYQNCSYNMFFFRERELLNSVTLRMNPIPTSLAVYAPIVYAENNIVRVDGDRITVSYNGECYMYEDITMYWNGYVNMNASFDTHGIISFYQTGSNFSHDVEIPCYLNWLAAIVNLIIAFLVIMVSDNLIKSIERICSSIDTNNINMVKWCKNQDVVKSAYIRESLILEY